jgi:hypothetical protein
MLLVMFTFIFPATIASSMLHDLAEANDLRVKEKKWKLNARLEETKSELRIDSAT